ncbi:beta-lactamase class C and other penicillin binding protein [Corynespora cassiicola Philippines]|uniref:Beta-lactamase class C and other penicillin binding protein n=1 Tax=Corynespora cassiicola Philippines TaxID=1448308 RepID=A0A2T2P555_CORCC|nr:beta-lactamase class C and other penicillin binding protein [Corynespora cassiicola Philippines]
MDQFEAVLDQVTAKGANNVPGAVFAVIDRDGNYLYRKAAGFNGITEDAKPLEFDQTFQSASCTKLIATIAALQCVERGLVTLDEPLDSYLPELASQPILEQSGDGEFNLRPAKNSITLRQLVTHSSGAAYDMMHPTFIAWRAPRGFSTTSDVAKDYAYPRAYEAGEGWAYGTGLDWTSLLVSRLTKKGFEEYVNENISKPLGLTTFTWHLDHHPHVKEKLMNMSSRSEDGKLSDGPTPLWPDPLHEAGGIGLYTNVHDYTRVLADLLKESPTLLQKESVDQMFTPQFLEGSNVLKALEASAQYTWSIINGGSTNGGPGNHGLGGWLTLKDTETEDYYKPKGTLGWSGMPNLQWCLNREKGLAFMFATQVLPWADPKPWELARVFENAVWRTFAR